VQPQKSPPGRGGQYCLARFPEERSIVTVVVTVVVDVLGRTRREILRYQLPIAHDKVERFLAASLRVARKRERARRLQEDARKLAEGIVRAEDDGLADRARTDERDGNRAGGGISGNGGDGWEGGRREHWFFVFSLERNYSNSKQTNRLIGSPANFKGIIGA